MLVTSHWHVNDIKTLMLMEKYSNITWSASLYLSEAGAVTGAVSRSIQEKRLPYCMLLWSQTIYL